MSKGNGRMLCSKCLGPLEPAFKRKRGRRYTAADGATAETISVVVGHCPQDGHYSTVFPDDIVRNKQYGISDIRSVLEHQADYSLASPRTRAYWRSWYRRVWDAAVEKIRLCVGRLLSEHDISIALQGFLDGCGDDWLRYVLDIFSAGINNVCMFFDLAFATIGHRGATLRGTRAEEGFEARKQPPGG